MNKFVIGEQEFLVVAQPLRNFLRLYGAASHLVSLLSRRLESYPSDKPELRQVNVIFDSMTRFIPMRLGFRPLCVYNLIYLEYANSYTTYRHLFNLPVNGQRTWGGGRSLRITQSQLYHYKLKRWGAHFNVSRTAFAAEIVNLMWRQQWRHEWEISRKYREKLPWYVQRKKKWLNVAAMVDRRVESFFKHPYRFKKKKHHRKKKKVNKHVITTGFDFGFSRFLLKNVG